MKITYTIEYTKRKGFDYIEKKAVERLEKFYAKKGISLDDVDIVCDTDGKELIYYASK